MGGLKKKSIWFLFCYPYYDGNIEWYIIRMRYFFIQLCFYFMGTHDYLLCLTRCQIWCLENKCHRFYCFSFNQLCRTTCGLSSITCNTHYGKLALSVFLFLFLMPVFEFTLMYGVFLFTLLVHFCENVLPLAWLLSVMGNSLVNQYFAMSIQRGF